MKLTLIAFAGPSLQQGPVLAAEQGSGRPDALARFRKYRLILHQGWMPGVITLNTSITFFRSQPLRPFFSGPPSSRSSQLGLEQLGPRIATNSHESA